MDWKKIKAEAKEKIDGKLWDVWKPALLVGFISTIISYIGMALFGEESVATEIFTLVFSLLLVPAEVGYISYMLKFIRGQEYGIEELKAFYSKITVLIVMNILIFIFVFLGTLALIIPGIILAFGYTMVFYIFVDNQELGAKEYLDKSKEMMHGYKMNYFLFSLSFIGWILLCVLIVPMIWVVPYMTTAQTIYYEELKKLKAEEI